MKEPARYMRLKDGHPTMVKLNKLFQLADELGISISYSSSGAATIRDLDFVDGVAPLILSDIEHSEYPMEDFPCTLDFKVTYENPAYLVYLGEQQRAKELEVEMKRRQEDQLLAEKKAKEAERKAKAKKTRRANRIINLKTRLQKDQAELKRLQQLTK